MSNQLAIELLEPVVFGGMCLALAGYLTYGLIDEAMEGGER